GNQRITPRAIRRPITGAPPQAEKSEGHQSEEKPFRINHAREQRAIRSRSDQRARPGSLRRQRPRWQPEPSKRKSVLRHHAISPRPREDDAVEHARRRKNH